MSISYRTIGTFTFFVFTMGMNIFNTSSYRLMDEFLLTFPRLHYTQNTAYALSGVNTRLNLLYSDSLNPNYIEDPIWDNNVNTILNMNNAMFQPLFSMREAYAADLVAIIVNNGQYCGSGGGAGYFFVNQDCMTGYYSLAHEIGHIMVRSREKIYANEYGLSVIFLLHPSFHFLLIFIFERDVGMKQVHTPILPPVPCLVIQTQMMAFAPLWVLIHHYQEYNTFPIQIQIIPSTKDLLVHRRPIVYL